MNALFTLQTEMDPEIKNQTYGEFVSDPLGHVALKRAEELAKMKIFDDYTNAIQLSTIPKQPGKKIDYQKDLSYNMNDERYKQTDIDREIDRMNAKEVKLIEREWVDEQKRKLQMQRDLQNKMDQMMQTHHSSMMGHQNFIKALRSPQENQERDSRLTRGKGAQNESQLSMVMDEETRIKKIIERKEEIERQNVRIGKTVETDNLAIISRYAELTKANRIETVRLPQIYKNSVAEQRLDVGYSLLQDFQNLLSTRMESQNYPVQ